VEIAVIAALVAYRDLAVRAAFRVCLVFLVQAGSLVQAEQVERAVLLAQAEQAVRWEHQAFRAQVVHLDFREHQALAGNLDFLVR
jgi:hypothetical protein